MKASEIGLPTHEASVSCGQWCLGGTVNMTPTAYAEHEDAEFVWVRGDVTGAALSALRAERDEAVALLKEESYEQYRFTQMTEYPSVTRMLLWHMDRRRRIDAFLAKAK